MTITENSGSSPAVIDFDEITFIDEATDIVQIAVREYEKSQAELRSEDSFSHDSTWSFLAHQIVGHEVST
jgi:hypothetical protein